MKTAPPRDALDRDAAEEVERLRAEVDRLSGELSAMREACAADLAKLSHDLRNPLNAFATSLALLGEVLRESEGLVARTLEGMDRSVEQMTRMLDELRESARRAADGGR